MQQGKRWRRRGSTCLAGALCALALAAWSWKIANAADDAPQPEASEAAVEVLQQAIARRSALDRDATGWTGIGPGPKLEGWTEWTWPPGPWAADVTTSGSERWSWDEAREVLRCNGSEHTQFLTQRTFRNFILHIEFRFPAVERPGSNSGIFVRHAPQVSRMTQVELMDSSGGVIGGRLEDGVLTQLETLQPGRAGAWSAAPRHTPRDWDRRVRRRLESPAVTAPTWLGEARRVSGRPKGEWNTIEVTCVGQSMLVWMNGGVRAYTDQAPDMAGKVGLESEGYPIEFRRILVKELP